MYRYVSFNAWSATYCSLIESAANIRQRKTVYRAFCGLAQLNAETLSSISWHNETSWYRRAKKKTNVEGYVKSVTSRQRKRVVGNSVAPPECPKKYYCNQFFTINAKFCTENSPSKENLGANWECPYFLCPNFFMCLLTIKNFASVLHFQPKVLWQDCNFLLFLPTTPLV